MRAQDLTKFFDKNLKWREKWDHAAIPACVRRALRKAKAAETVSDSMGASKKVVMVFGHRSAEHSRPSDSPVVVKTLPIEPDGAHLREIGIKRSGGFLELEEGVDGDVRHVEWLPPGSSREEEAKELSTILEGVTHIRIYLPREELAEPIEINLKDPSDVRADTFGTRSYRLCPGTLE